LAGCGGGPLVKLQGRLTQDGRVVQWNEPTPLEVRLFLQNPDPIKAGQSYAAEVGQDGSFTVQGKGIPPGSYKLAVVSKGDRPGTKPPPFLKDLSNAATSRLTYEVAAGADQKIVIDLAKKTVQPET
jgi:hypothetical protein